MKKQNLNEQVSRIKDMMGLNESQRHRYSQEEMENDMINDQIMDMLYEIFADDKITSDETIDQIADNIKSKFFAQRKWDSDIYEFVKNYMLEYAEEASQAYNDAPGASEGGQLKHRQLEGSIYDDAIYNKIMRATQRPEPTDDQIFNGPGMEGGISYGGGGSNWQGR